MTAQRRKKEFTNKYFVVYYLNEIDFTMSHTACMHKKIIQLLDRVFLNRTTIKVESIEVQNGAIYN